MTDCPHPHQQALYSLEQVWLRYRAHTPWVLQNCTMDLYPGERILISGPNGSGKSTLLKLLAGMIRPQAGTCGHCHHQPCTCAYLAQEQSIDWQLPFSVADVVWCGRCATSRWRLKASRRDYQQVAAALEAVGMYELRKQSVQALSGGQRQRLLIARTLAQEARALLLDEPLSGLDSAARQQLAHTLETVCARYGLAVVLTSHERDSFPFAFDRHLTLQDGALAPVAMVGA